MKKRLFVALAASLTSLVMLLILIGLLCESSPSVTAPLFAAPNAVPAPVRQNQSSAAPVTDGLSYLFEDFNDTIYQVNDFTGWWDKVIARCITTTFATDTYTGTPGASLRIDYHDVLAGKHAGVWFAFRDYPGPPTQTLYLDFTDIYGDLNEDCKDFEQIHFWVRGSGTTTETHHLLAELKDVTGTLAYIPVDVDDDDTTWREVALDVTTFSHPWECDGTQPDLTMMKELVIVVDGSRPSGTFYIDEIHFVDADDSYFDPSQHTDDEFLDLLEKRAFQYFLDYADPTTGLVRDRAADRDVSRSSIAATGFGLTAMCIAKERGWITHGQAYNRVLTTLNSFYDDGSAGDLIVSGTHGLFYHFVNIHDGTPIVDSEVSTIDSALLMAGVLSAKQCFTETEIVTRATAIYEAAEWDWFQDTDGSHCPIGQMHAGWRPPTTTVETDGLFGCWGGYNEGMILYLLAIGSPTHPVSPTAWISWANTYKEHWGAFYGYPVLACPALFTHQYSHCWIDFRNKRDNYTNYFRNSVYASLANRAYSNDVWYPDVDLWGSTASYGPLTATCRVTTTCPPREGTWAAWRPWVEPGTCDENAPCTSAVTSTCAAGVDEGTAYHSYGYPPEVEWNDGTIAPTAAGGSIVFTPDYSISTLRHMYEKYFRKLWGFQGLKDSLNIRSEPDWFANDYVGIDVGAMLLMIENYGTGFVWDIFMRNQEVGGAMRAVGFVTDTTKIPSWFYYREAEECNLASGVGISVEVHTMAWNAKTLQIDRDAEPNPGNFALYTITVDYEENSSMFFAIRYSDDVAGDVIDVYLDGVKKGSFTTDKFASDGWEAFGWDSERINMGVVAPGIHTIKLEVAAENAGEYGLLYGVNLDVFQLYTSLEVSKQATPNPVRPGAPLIYTLSVTNTSGITLTATITDILPDYVTPTSVHTWTPPPIAPDGVWTEQVTATVQMGYCGPLTNEVQIATEERATGSAITVVDVFCFRVYLPLMLRRFP